MKNYTGVLIVLVGIAMMFPAPIQLIRHGYGYPNEQLLAQLWLGGIPLIMIGIAVNWITTPPRK